MQNTPLVMVSGLTRAEDAALAVELGARCVACTAGPEVPRSVGAAEAREIFRAAGRGIAKVLSFRAGDAREIAEFAKKAGTRHVQLDQFPEEAAVELEGQGFVVYRVHRIPFGSNVPIAIQPEPSPKRPVIIRSAEGKDDVTFPWELLGNQAPPGAFIGGNVRPENVCALLTHNPYGLDVCRGVEQAPGVKDRDRLAMLFETVRLGYQC